MSHDEDYYEVLGMLCGRCAMPITGARSLTGRQGQRIVWLSAPIADPVLSAQCPHGGAHVPRRDDGLVIAGLVTPESIQEDAMAMSEVAMVLIEYVTHLARQRRSTAA